MDRRHEQLDVDELERLVARAVVALVDEPREQIPISARLLAQRCALPLRRVREVIDAWELRTLTGDALFLPPTTLDRLRALAAAPG